VYKIFPSSPPLKKCVLQNYKRKNVNKENGTFKKYLKKHLKTLDFFHEHNVLLVLMLIIVIHHFSNELNA
jgi:hypothetical protein